MCIFNIMKHFFFILSLFAFITLSCSKEKEQIEPIEVNIPEQYERFIGNYKVYDTLGVFMYDMSIIHNSKVIYPNGQRSDTITIQNFADTFDVKYEFRNTIDKNGFDFGFHDSIVDYNNKSWGLWSLSDDTTSIVKENQLLNDTMVMYFKMDNIKYYMQEAQPYYMCECKHVAVKQ